MIPRLSLTPVTRISLRNFVFLLFAYILVILVLYPSIILHFSDRVPFGREGDVQNILSIIQYHIHTPPSLTNLYNLPFLYPHSLALASTHPLIGVSLFFKLFQLLGLSLIQSNNLFILLSMLLGAWGCFLLTREYIANRTMAFAVSLLYFLHPRITTNFHWLNFMSAFYLPFILYHFIRFARTGRKRHAGIITGLMVLQTISSLYYGLFLWLLVVPLMAILGTVFKLLTRDHWYSLILGLLVAVLFLLVLLHPYFLVNNILSAGTGSDNASATIPPSSLFTSGKLTALLPDSFSPPAPSTPGGFPVFSPGLVFYLLLFSFFIKHIPGSRFPWYLGFAVTAVVITSLAVFGCYLGIEILALAGFLVLYGLAFQYFRRYSATERVIILCSLAVLLLFISFSEIPVLKSISLYRITFGSMPIPGFRVISRVIPYFIPFFIVPAGIGLQSIGRRLNQRIPGKRGRAIIILLVLIMIMENYPLRMLKSRTLQKLPGKEESRIYREIPYKENQIILEMPYYYGLMVTQNSQYMLQWKSHRNYLLNGKVSPHFNLINSDLDHILGGKDIVFPTESKLKQLIYRFGVTHVIFHWDRYRSFFDREEQSHQMKKNIEAIQHYGKIFYQDEDHTVLQLKEFRPVSRIVRTYSSYHLNHHNLLINLESPYTGTVVVFLNQRFVTRFRCENKSFTLRFRQMVKDVNGNQVVIKFQHPVSVQSCQLL